MAKAMGKVVAILILLLCLPASATEVLVGSSDWTGSTAVRTTAVTGEIAATDGWGVPIAPQNDGTAAALGFEITWKITPAGGGLLNYEYTLSNQSGGNLSKGLSHVILEVSSGASIGVDILNISGTRLLLTGENAPAIGDWTATSNGNSNPGLPGTLHGIKLSFDTTDPGTLTSTVSFTSNRLPIWGDFYARDGSDTHGTIDVTAWNTGSADTGDTITPASPYAGYIPTPDNTIVPEPSLTALALIGLVGGALGRRVSRKRKVD